MRPIKKDEAEDRAAGVPPAGRASLQLTCLCCCRRHLGLIEENDFVTEWGNVHQVKFYFHCTGLEKREKKNALAPMETERSKIESKDEGGEGERCPGSKDFEMISQLSWWSFFLSHR